MTLTEFKLLNKNKRNIEEFLPFCKLLNIEEYSSLLRHELDNMILILDHVISYGREDEDLVWTVIGNLIGRFKSEDAYLYYKLKYF